MNWFKSRDMGLSRAFKSSQPALPRAEMGEISAASTVQGHLLSLPQ